jgi:hypothetical protein
MRKNTKAEVAVIGIRLIDDAYLAWIAAEAEAEILLHAWFEGRGQQRDAAYLAYRAALEREDASARDLERLCRLAAGHPDAVFARTETLSL